MASPLLKTAGQPVGTVVDVESVGVVSEMVAKLADCAAAPVTFDKSSTPAAITVNEIVFRFIACFLKVRGNGFSGLPSLPAITLY